MANPLFNAIMGRSEPFGNSQSNSSPNAPQTATAPSNAQKITMQDAMCELKNHPAQLIKQAGFNVPDEIANNPQASVMHLIQSGQIGGPMMQRIRPMLNMLMGGRR
jgi:hypothetical protein